MIFASRWLQVPIYAGLTVVRAICAYKFLKSLKHLVMNLDVSDENAIMLAVLNLIDVGYDCEFADHGADWRV